MNSEIIFTGLSTLSGAFIGGLFTYLAAKKDYRSKKIKKDILRLSLQIKSYHSLEKLYSQKISLLEKKNQKTILQEMRTKVEKSGLERPRMTSKEADKIYQSWS